MGALIDILDIGGFSDSKGLDILRVKFFGTDIFARFKGYRLPSLRIPGNMGGEG